MDAPLDQLTDKERAVLRLILEGHDAKSMARELALSVHTVNDRLRAARRKLGVTSSREAARLLREAEGPASQNLAHKPFAGASAERIRNDPSQPAASRPGWQRRALVIVTGGMAMTIVLAALAIVLGPGSVTAPAPVAAVQQDREAEMAARQWLEQVDAGDAEGTYARTSAQFRSVNTLDAWRQAFTRVRGPLGATVSRELTQVDLTPTPQHYTIVKFTTRFANRETPMVETVSLVEEGGEWRIAGIYVE